MLKSKNKRMVNEILSCQQQGDVTTVVKWVRTSVPLKQNGGAGVCGGEGHRGEQRF